MIFDYFQWICGMMMMFSWVMISRVYDMFCKWCWKNMKLNNALTRKHEHIDVIARSTMHEHKMKQMMNDIMTSYENHTWQRFHEQQWQVMEMKIGQRFPTHVMYDDEMNDSWKHACHIFHGSVMRYYDVISCYIYEYVIEWNRAYAYFYS